MTSIISQNPENLNLNIEVKINKLKIAVSILQDHLNQFGHIIKQKNPRAYDTLMRELKFKQRELDIRLKFPIIKR
jgi:hypothetical protein